MTQELEFWPDHGGGPLWRAGAAVQPDELGLSTDLGDRLRRFNDAYEEERLPVDGAGDAVYLAAGAQLLAEVREALSGSTVVVTEPWWGEPASADEP